VGNGALQNNTSGTPNTAVGANALVNNLIGTNNVAVGDNALVANTGNLNTAVGSGAGSSLTSADGNTFLGVAAGNLTTTGRNNTYIGRSANGSAPTNTFEIVICANDTGAYGKGSSTSFIQNPCYQGNNQPSWSVVSDQRIKRNIATIASGLDVINALRPVTFDYALAKEMKLTQPSDAGFVVQEYQKVLPEQCGEVAASPLEQKLTGSETLLSMTPNLNPYLVAAIQELTARVAQLEGK
jgi:hypothetical protein